MANLFGEDMFSSMISGETDGQAAPMQPRLTWLVFDAISVPEYLVLYISKDSENKAVIHLTTGQTVKSGNDYEEVMDILA